MSADIPPQQLLGATTYAALTDASSWVVAGRDPAVTDDPPAAIAAGVPASLDSTRAM